MKLLATFILFITLSAPLLATHNRAGEICYRHINGFTYEITMVTYTYSLSYADRPELEVTWGDGSKSIVQRIHRILLPDFYYKNIYKGTHTYPGNGIYTIMMIDLNRNEGVINIPNSVNQPFTIRTTLNINATVGNNTTPTLSYPPIDKAKLYYPFIHNPTAYDPDGDSLSYKITMCLGENGQVVNGYTYPHASDSLLVNPVTGDLIWASPQQTGIYNVAMLVEEWRKNPNTGTYIKISELLRDIQIEVVQSSNMPPVLSQLQDICADAGDYIEFPVSVTDPNGDRVSLNAYGGPFQVSNSPALFDTVEGYSPLVQNFTWQTNCSHVKKFPYLVVFRAKDINSEINLVAQKKVYIQIVSPPPDSLTLQPSTNSVQLSWNVCPCQQATHYNIYRKQSPSGWQPAHCETGLPPSTGFEKIKTINDITATSFLDNNNGQGLSIGYEYCYRIVAVFQDGAESYASNEACTELVKGIPVMTHISVEKTDNTLGKDYIEWSKPTEFDSLVAPGPYKYLIYRSDDFWGTNLSLIDSLGSINDTIYIDTTLNTTDYPYTYKVEFYNDSPRFLIGYPQPASSVFLKAIPDDNRLILQFSKNVPWINFRYDVFRLNAQTQNFDSIGTTTLTQYIDSGLVNGNTYCYKVISYGKYVIGNYNMPFINKSQEICGVPADTTPPCPPLLSLSSECTEYYNRLVWRNPNHYCTDDVVAYNIYFSPSLTGEMVLIKTIGNPNDTVFEHSSDISLAGCYIVTAIDSFQNESRMLNRICIDICNYYELPNIFTPDWNTQNDLFVPGPHRFVTAVDIKIYNRWGKLVFQTTDPDILWDGRDIDTKKSVPPGVYYYICDVWEQRLTGIEPRNITGFVHITRLKSSGSE